MANPIIRKSYAVPQAEFKAGGDESGTITGFAAAMGNMDSWGDVIFPGAFSKGGAIADFLQRGFVATGHKWDDYVAMPTIAKEEGVKLYTEAVFHSDDDAQKIRKRCQERMDRGLAVGLSIGFSIAKGGYAWFESGEAMLKFLEESKMDLSGWDIQSIKDYPYSCRAITEVKRLYEYSIVPVPANSSAVATDVKSFSENGSLLAGLSLSDALDTALAAVDELAERFGSYQSLKAEDGRNVNEDRLIQLRSLHARLGAFLMKAEQPADEPADEDAAQTKAHDLHLRTLAARTAAMAAGAR